MNSACLLYPLRDHQLVATQTFLFPIGRSIAKRRRGNCIFFSPFIPVPTRNRERMMNIHHLLIETVSLAHLKWDIKGGIKLAPIFVTYEEVD